jgi:RHS repeat-associated protein
MASSRIIAAIRSFCALLLLLMVQSATAQVPAPSSSTGNDNWDKNWVRVKTYDENGNVIGESKQFFDKNGNAIQSQKKVKYRKDPTTAYTHVLASQPIRDVFGRDAVITLEAPIDNSEFIYKPDFVRNGGGTVYDFKNFDRYDNGSVETDKTNNPDPLGNTTSTGTLGWYYSANNGWEPYMPLTSYPYTRQSFYRDGSESLKKSAGLGEVFKMGSGREVFSFVMPVNNELDHYLQVRNKFFPAAELGLLPASLQFEATQSISRDANGREAVIIKDRGGKSLITGRPGNELIVPGTYSVEAGAIFYFRTFATGNITISAASNLFYNMDTEQLLSFGTGGSISAGYYKVANTGSSPLTVSYTNGYADLSYSFYNQLGQLVAIIAPEGVKKLYGTGINNFSTKNDVPFITLYEYDVAGKLVKITTTDGGYSEMVYRKDGNLRFSQNSIQRITGRYTYTNYDTYGRIIEIGEYQPDGSGITFTADMSVGSGMKNILENTSSTGGLTSGTKRDVSITQFDVADNSHGLSSYVQDYLFLNGMVTVMRKYSLIVNNTPNSNDLVSATWSNYDETGVVTWMIRYIKGLGYKTTDYTYDAMSRLTKKVFQKNTAAETFVHYFEYDPATQKLWKVYTNTVDNSATKSLQATYVYYLHGPLKRIELASNLQGIDYTYTLQGHLKAINNSDKTKDPGGDGSNGFASDAYGMVLDYHADDYVNTRGGIQPIKGVNTSGIVADSYVGIIKAMTWYSRKPVGTPGMPAVEEATTYVFDYDDKYQFTESTWGTGVNFANTPASFTATGNNKEKIKNPIDGTPAYDDNGNILYLQRTNAAGSTIDKFTYNYVNHTNRLQSVVHDNGGSPQTYASYTYDALGQLVIENVGSPATQKYIQYDGTGKVVAVARDAAFNQKVVEYVYGELGQRIMKKSYNGAFQLSQVTYYTGDVIFTQPYSGGTGGVITPQEYEINDGAGRLGIHFRPTDIYAYQLSDHLGNVRAVIARSGITYEVRMYSDYYPYGMTIGSFGTPYRYGFQGQYAEYDGETNWNAFELRMYDSRIGRWLSIDPAGQYYSPYVGMGNNPVNGVDKDGGLFGALIGALVGGLIEGTVAWANGGDFWEGAKRGAVRGAVAGAIFDAAYTGGASLVVAGALGGVYGEMADQAFFGDGQIHFDRLVLAGVTGGVAPVIMNYVAGHAVRLASGKIIRPSIGVAESESLGIGAQGEINAARSAQASKEAYETSLMFKVRAKLNLYPQVIDPRTGQYIKLPYVEGVVDKTLRANWGAAEREAFIKAWHQKGFPRPKGGWDKYDIHHIQPREFGGTNDFWNLVPVLRETHQQYFNTFWRQFGGL